MLGPIRLTGQSLNLAVQLGAQDYSNLKFALATIANYCGGFAFYKCLDVKVTEGKKTCTAVAPIILALTAASDQLRLAVPGNRFKLMPLAIAGGMINGLGA